MKNYVVERLNGKIVRQFIVTTPDVSETDFYRQSLSMEAFKSHWRTKTFNEGPSLSRMFFLKFEHDVRFNEEHSSAIEGVTQTFFTSKITPIEFTSIWDFYRYIGWDYKTKRFTDDSD